MRNMILPATVGIGLAVGGACSRTESTPVYSAPLPEDAAALRQDAPGGPETARHDVAPVADLPGDVAGPDLSEPGRDLSPGRDLPPGRDLLADAAPDAAGPRDVPSSSDSPTKDDLQPNDGASTEAALRRDTMPDVGGVKYIAPFFDGGPADTRKDLGADSPADAPADLGSVSVKYLAQLPDAAVDNTPVLRYMAQMPDAASGPVALYMAPAPGGA
jgi:hypothetical protein